MFDLRSFVIGTVLMLRKFTLINIKIYEESQHDDYVNGIMMLPFIGLAIGFFACFISAFRLFYDKLFVSVLVLAFYCIVTGNVNLIDTYRTLNYIIKPKNGSEQISGIIGIIIICLLYVSLISLVNVEALIITMIAGFSGLIILSTVFQRNKEGTSIMVHCTNYHKISAFVVSFASASLINCKLVIPLALTYMVSGVIVSVIDKKIKVLPLSIEGFIIEMTQLLFLIITYIFKII